MNRVQKGYDVGSTDVKSIRKEVVQVIKNMKGFQLEISLRQMHGGKEGDGSTQSMIYDCLTFGHHAGSVHVYSFKYKSWPLELSFLTVLAELPTMSINENEQVAELMRKANLDEDPSELDGKSNPSMYYPSHLDEIPNLDCVRTLFKCGVCP